MKQALTLIVSLFVGASALAHTGVTNPQVLAWMDGMKELGQTAKTLGLMARGQLAFDPKEAENALAALSEETARIPVLFETEARDPNSEAHPNIWNDRAAFEAAVRELDMAISSARVASPDDLRLSLKEIGQSCSNCHKSFRVER